MEILRSITTLPALEGQPPKGELKDAVKLTKLTEGEDIEAYLKTFERLMEAYEVPKEQWAYRLAPQLTGKAQQAYAAVSSDSTRNYDEVKTTILRRYNINEETYRSRFRSSQKGPEDIEEADGSSRRKEGEGYFELAIRMSDLLERWTVGCRSVAELREMLLPPELRIWVNERKPKSADEAATLADDYMTARRTGKHWKETGGKERLVVTQLSTRVGLIAGGATYANGLDILLTTVPLKESERTPALDTKKGKPTSKNIKCYSCGNLGHMSMQCPDKAWFCGGGIPKRMSRRSGLVVKTRVKDIVLDTGCTRTMVRRDLVPEDKLLEGEAVAVWCAHGDTVLYPLAEVEMELGGDRMAVTAAVADRLPVSVLVAVDVPVLGKLLHGEREVMHSHGVEEALVVTTRSRTRQEEREELEMAQKEAMSGGVPKPLELNSPAVSEGEGEANAEEEVAFKSEFQISVDLFSSKSSKTRSEKREQRYSHGLERAKDRKQKNTEIPVSRAVLLQLQSTDESLEKIRALCEGKSDDVEDGYFKKDGLIGRLPIKVVKPPLIS